MHDPVGVSPRFFYALSILSGLAAMFWCVFLVGAFFVASRVHPHLAHLVMRSIHPLTRQARAMTRGAVDSVESLGVMFG